MGSTPVLGIERETRRSAMTPKRTAGHNQPMSDIEDRIQFAGLTRHNNAEISEKAEKAADSDHSRDTAMYPDNLSDTSFASAIRTLERAKQSTAAWQVPDDVARHIDVDNLNENSPDDVAAHRTEDGSVFVKTDRFQSIISPDKLQSWANDDFRTDEDDGHEYRDPLWHIPSKNYSIVNPLTAYEPLEQAIRDEDLGDAMFGEIRTYKDGGEVHMDILFDAFSIDYKGDDDGSTPILLGIRTGYDFFGSQALYFEGFAQDMQCSNSIRSVTDEKTIRHVGEVDLEDEVEDVLTELGLMTDRLAELIEMAEDIELELLDQDFAVPFDHDDNLRALYELAGFPSYLAMEAAKHARQRADNRFMPDMTDVWDGATYALTHHYRGGENTSRAQELIDHANDFVMNPTQVIGQVETEHKRRLASDGEDGTEQATLSGESAHASVQQFSESVAEKRNKFESRNDELKQALVAGADGDGGAE